MSVYDISIVGMDGKPTSLKTYEGKVMLIVNVASKCGFKPQYAELEKLQQEYQDRGFSVLGFPCDQFLHQEPGSNEQIKEFAESCFRVTFPLFAKLDVKGKHQSELYAYLQKHVEKRTLKFIPWNFSKILVKAKGRVLKRYLPTTSFKKIKEDIDAQLT